MISKVGTIGKVIIIVDNYTDDSSDVLQLRWRIYFQGSSKRNRAAARRKQYKNADVPDKRISDRLRRNNYGTVCSYLKVLIDHCRRLKES